ncbi:MAG: HypC/HybG/HupF family hydrogenase formation chaperone [Deltaproteobacteria bacterium]|nr:HypC/HybG/HupF family hydrogenase formation chaperone [Deltaproteobacteria bacterium]
MCIAVAGKVVERHGNHGLVQVGAATMDVNLALVPQVAAGDWVLVHAGFGIEVVTEEHAAETMDLVARLLEAPEGP